MHLQAGEASVILSRAQVLAVLLESGCLGGPVEQSAACRTYVECITELDETQGLTTNLARFEKEGVCFGNAEISELCTAGCDRALQRMRARTATLPSECSP